MEVSSEKSGEDVAPEMLQSSPKKNVPEASRRAAKTVADGPVSAKRKVEPRTGSVTAATKRSGSIGGSASAGSAPRRNSTGGLSQKASISDGRRKTGAESAAGARSGASSGSEPVRRSLPELRRSSVTSSRVAVKPAVASPAAPASASRTSVASKVEVAKKPVSKPALSALTSASSLSRRIGSSSVDSTASSSGSARRTVSRVSSPTVSSGLKAGYLSTSQDRTSAMSGRRKGSTADSRDSRFIVLPQVEIKANDDLFVYLRDNLLSTLEGVEVLTRVKVLDLSFNEFKGPGFEPLENCKVLQQLYLAGNQITSLASLPQLPNLEFLSVAQNKLKSLTMASQPRLQVLAASKNKISTLKGFPYLPVLEHLRVEENPILKMPHLEAASILLVGPTLKKFNDRVLQISLVRKWH
uniref:Uncharacterized protein n=1 Tax=Glycine max TaxID=3847 RepID=A0A0R0GCQ2_SOYBN